MNMKSMSMYSTQYLVGAPFAWITAAMRRGMESISLWHCSGVMRAQVALTVAFSSSALLGLAYRIFLFTIPHRFSMGLRSGEFAGQFLNGFCFIILSRVRLSLLLVHFFLPHLFLPFASLLMCLDTELCEQPASFAMTFCLALLVQGVNGRLLDNCQVSSLPHDCVAYRTRLRDHLKAFAGVLS